jgi:hypothetical protein
MGKALPASKDGGPLAGRVSVLLEGPGEEAPEAGSIKEALLEALAKNTVLAVSYGPAKKETEKISFQPVHFILTGGREFVFGIMEPGQKDRYTILSVDRIYEAAPQGNPITPPSFVYIQTTGNHDIEVVISREESDLLLIFSSGGDTRKKQPAEYALIAQTEIFS